MSKRVDLHIHTHYSDGSWSPKEVVENIQKTDIEVFATADHDNIEALPIVENLVKDTNLEYVKAVEASVKAFGVEYHILTYDIDPKNKELNELLNNTLKIRKNREVKIIEFAKEKFKDINLDLDEFIEYRKNAPKGVIASIGYLTDKKVISNIPEYNAIKEEVSLLPEDDLPLAENVFPVLKRAGGTVVLAHPSYHFPGFVMDLDKLDFFRDVGIDGIECYCAYNHKPEQSLFYLEYCKEYDLAVSGGSDCHGARYNRPLGFPKINMSMISVLGRTRNYSHLQDDEIFPNNN